MSLYKTLALLLCAVCVAAARADDPRSYASFYVETYGTADPATPQVQRAYQIFERLTQVADKTIVRTPGFRVINSDNRPWAIALPDGNIILSLGALKVCYTGVTQAAGDARLAFVLGHELSHLTAKHFWHRDAFLSLSGQRNQSVARLTQSIGESAGVLAGDRKSWQKTMQQRELEADDSGFLMASLAGYQTDALIDDPSQDFFSHWVEQTRSHNDALHVSPQERAEFLRVRLTNILAKKDYFDYGVRLLYFGRYRDAIYFFKEFQRHFPSKEVLNNLGYAHLQLARKQMAPAYAFHYWLPTNFETENQQLVFSTRSGAPTATLSAEARKELRKAVDYLDLAARSNAKHLASRLNLATAYLYLQEYHKARAAIEEALKIAPDAAQAKGLRAVILFEQEKEIDMWPAATKILDRLANNSSAGQPFVFNLARLHDARGRAEQARQYWLRLAGDSLAMPDAYRAIVCQRTNDAGNCKAPRTAEGGKNVDINLPLAPGLDTASPEAAAVLRNWKRDTSKLGPLRVDIYSGRKGESILALDHKIEMVVFDRTPIKTAEDVLRCCGAPVAKVATTGGDIWSYQQPWAVLVKARQVKELWVARELAAD